MTIANIEIAANRQKPDLPSRAARRAAKAARHDRAEGSAGSSRARNHEASVPETAGIGRRDLSAHPEKDHRIIENRQRFSEIYEPRSAEESGLVHRLAIAQGDLDNARAALEERLRWQQSHTRELYARGQLDRFRADLKAWRADPFAMCSVFGQTWFTASFLRDLWNSVEIGLETESRVTYEQIKDIVRSQCGDWRVDRLDGHRGRLMCWFLALHQDDDEIIDRWVRDSRAGRNGLGSLDADFSRARAFRAAAPSADEAKRNLKELAAKEYQAWSARADRLFQASLAERAHFAQITPSHPLGDAADVRETRRIQNNFQAAQNRFDKLERRLLALRKARSGRKPTQASDTETLRPCTIETTPESAQPEIIEEDMSHLRNGPDVGTKAPERDAPPAEPARTGQQARRPNPQKLAKTWRAKCSHTAKPANRRGKSAGISGCEVNADVSRVQT